MDAVTTYRELDEVLAGFQGLRMLAKAAEDLHDTWGLPFAETTENAIRENIGGLLKTLTNGLAAQTDALDRALIEARQAEGEAAA